MKQKSMSKPMMKLKDMVMGNGMMDKKQIDSMMGSKSKAKKSAQKKGKKK